MHCGVDKFQVVQAAYHDAYIRANVDMLNFLQHNCFFNVRDGVVKSKQEFLKIVQMKLERGKWFSSDSSFTFEQNSIEVEDLMVSSCGIYRVKTLDSVFSMFVKELWIFVPDVSWKILSFVIHTKHQ